MNIELIEHYFILFLIYSFLGWIAETILCFFITKKLVNRGFLIGPVCPIYGCGAVLITMVLTRYSDDCFVLFGLSAIMCGSLEYFTSYIMEKLFNARWWDYTDHKYNINGRVCLENILMFGIAGVFIITLGNVWIDKFINWLFTNNYDIYFSVIFGLIFLIDLIVSLKVMNKIKDITLSIKGQVKDNTEEITKTVRDTLNEKSLPYKRIILAFPQAFATKIKEGTQKIKDTAEMVRTKTVTTINKAKIKTIENVKSAKEKTIENVKNAKEKTFENMKNAKEITSQKVKNFRTNFITEKSNKLSDSTRVRKIMRAIKGARIKVIRKMKR